jgi:hypothetical protein
LRALHDQRLGRLGVERRGEEVALSVLASEPGRGVPAILFLASDKPVG